MKAKFSREKEYEDVKIIYIEIGDNQLRLQETSEGGLLINKISLEKGIDNIKISPRTVNEIIIE